MPYRARKQQGKVPAAKTGVVADMVRQFADPYALMRELVQNGIDAGATRIDVRAELGADGSAVLSARDDGSGMTREIIEGPLLTLFASAKDGDSTKIGKYGVGFVSVFAIKPSEVLVETWTSEGAWLLRLRPDHSYELESAVARGGSGTLVSLVIDGAAEHFDEHVARTRQALLRWCRHAGVAIHLTVRRQGGDDSAPERLDTKLSLRASLTVREVVDGGEYVIGPGSHNMTSMDSADPEDGASFAGFYCRGLTLHETTQPPRAALAGLRFKVNSARLQHTLSRDNVRHDAAYDEALSHLEDMVVRLRSALRSELRATATRLARKKQAEHDYAALLWSACSEPLQLPNDELTVPLVEPISGKRYAMGWEVADGNRILFADKSGPLSAAAAQRHIPVVLAKTADIAPLLGACLAKPAVALSDAFLLLDQDAAAASASDRELCEELQHALVAAGARVLRTCLVARHGVVPQRAAVAVVDPARSQLVAREEIEQRWSGRLRSGRTLLLVADHAAVQNARGLAEHDPVTAAQLLARYLLVEERGELSAKQSDALLDVSLKRSAARKRRRKKRRPKRKAAKRRSGKR